tara:strand:- start:2664 stop:2873 length:210 start_codon:yes stop_codon:yes gene_type:complete
LGALFYLLPLSIKGLNPEYPGELLKLKGKRTNLAVFGGKSRSQKTDIFRPPKKGRKNATFFWPAKENFL